MRGLSRPIGLRSLPARARSRLERIVVRRRLLALAADPAAAEGMCVVYGNCQAEPLRRLLAASRPFPHPTLALPPVHLMDAREAEALGRVLPHVALFVTQPVRDGYRDLGLGSQEMARLLGAGRVVKVVQLHYQGLFPFQVYVRHEGHLAPYSEYDDLRFLLCAARGLAADRAAAWLRDFRPEPETVRALARESREELARREHEHAVDVRAAERMTRPDLHARAFHTINHPRLELLAHVARGVCEHLGAEFELRITREPLARIQTPLEPEVRAALGLDGRAGPVSRDWRLEGTRVERERLLAAHLAAYARRPEVVQAGLHQHAERMARLDLRP